MRARPRHLPVGLVVATAALALVAPGASAAARDVTRGAGVPSSVGPAPFDDVAGSAFAFEIACMAEVDVARGDNRRFGPEVALTRGQAASLLYRLS